MSPAGGGLERFFGAVAGFAVRRPSTVLAVAAAVTVASLGLTVRSLTLRTSNLDLVDPRLPPVARFLDFAERFGTPNLLVVVLEGEDPAALRSTADRLASRLAEVPGAGHVYYRLPVDPGAVEVLGIDPYLAADDGGMVFLFVQPADPSSSVNRLEPFVHGVEALLAEEVDGRTVRAGLTGMPRFALDDRDVVQGDISRLSALSLILVLALFAASFGALRRPLAAAAALLVGVALTLGLATLYPGHLTLLSAFFASILFGLGIDSGIHVVDRLEERLAAGETVAEAVPRAVAALAPGLAASTLTTASLLWAMRWSGFRGFEELGTIAGCGVVICLLAMVTVLPALLVLIGGGRGRARRLERRRLGRALIALRSRPAARLLAAAALAGALAGLPPFDTDYLDLQPAGSQTVRLEREMVRRSSWSPEFAAFTAGTRQELKDLVWELVNDETVGKVRSALDFELFLPGAAGYRAADLTSAFEDADGRYAVYAYPEANVWDPAEQQAFVAHMQAIDPEVTGMPFLGSFMVERSQRALAVTAAVGAPLLLLWVLLIFRDLRWTFLAILPTLLTVSSLAGLMKLLGLSFNPLNVMALPVVLGIAVDDGIHVVHRFRAEGGDLGRTLAGTGRGVVLTSATTLAAFGTLALTSHRGLASFALVLSLGVAVALLQSVVVLPEFLRVAGTRSWASLPEAAATRCSRERSGRREPSPDATVEESETITAARHRLAVLEGAR